VSGSKKDPPDRPRARPAIDPPRPSPYRQTPPPFRSISAPIPPAPPSSAPQSDAYSAARADWPDDETYSGGSTHPSGRPRPTTTVKALLEEPMLGVRVKLLGGDAGTDRIIDHPRIQKSGLSLAGHFHGISPTRIQILGRTEQSYLDRLDSDARRGALAGFFGQGLSCVVLTGGLGPSAVDLVALAKQTGTPLVSSNERSSATITAFHATLDEKLAPRQRLHAVLVDVFGVGLLLMGSSGVGKSECALDLVMRGHRLVADDVVECAWCPPGMIFGAPAQLLRYHLEVRGLGILNIKDLYGVTAIRERKRIDVVVKLAEERDLAHSLDQDRLGLEEHFHDILGVAIPELRIPVRPGRDMASILEVAARNELLKNAGHHAGRELLSAIEREHLAAHDVPQTLRGARPAMMSEHEINRGGRSDESALPPPVGRRAPPSSEGTPAPPESSFGTLHLKGSPHGGRKL
jgi:HPr kinase/phosphorylase